MLKFVKSLGRKLFGIRRSIQNDESWFIHYDEKYKLVYSVRDKDLGKLHKAAWYGHLDKDKMLVKQDPNAFDKCHRTPLHLACCQGFANIVEQLLVLNAHTNVKDNESKTPLMKAVECGHADVVEVLLSSQVDGEARSDGEDTLLHLAIKYGHVTVINVLLKAKTNPNLKNMEGKTPLHYAVLKQDFTITDILLRHKADVNETDFNERTVLMVACYFGLDKIIALLLKNGASISVKDRKGLSASNYALLRGHKDCYMLLVYEQLRLQGQLPNDSTRQSKKDASSTSQIIPGGFYMSQTRATSSTMCPTENDSATSSADDSDGKMESDLDASPVPSVQSKTRNEDENNIVPQISNESASTETDDKKETPMIVHQNSVATKDFQKTADSIETISYTSVTNEIVARNVAEHETVDNILICNSIQKIECQKMLTSTPKPSITDSSSFKTQGPDLRTYVLPSSQKTFYPPLRSEIMNLKLKREKDHPVAQLDRENTRLKKLIEQETEKSREAVERKNAVEVLLEAEVEKNRVLQRKLKTQKQTASEEIFQLKHSLKEALLGKDKICQKSASLSARINRDLHR